MAPKTGEQAQEATEPISLEERLAATEERLAAAMEVMATIAQQGAGRDAGGNGGDWGTLSQAEALRKMQGTVSDMLEGDTLLEDVGEQPVTFISKGAYFKSNRLSRQRTTAPNGEVAVSKGVCYDFAPLGTYTAKTVEAVAWLRSRPMLNLEFWELGKEPHAAPNADKVMDKILEALGDFDDGALEAIELIEQASHKREGVLKAVAKARKVVQGVVSSTEEAVA